MPLTSHWRGPLKSGPHSDIRLVKAWAKRLKAELLATGLSREMTGRQLRAFRDWLGLTQQQLADILGVQRVSVARAEIGKYRKKQEANPDREISRLLHMLLERALEKGGIRLSVVAEPGGEYGKNVSKKTLNDIGLSVLAEPHAEYGTKVPKKSVKRPPKKES